MKQLKGLIFDLDGVITDSAEYHFIAWKNLANSIGIEINREFNEQLKGVSREDSLEKILKFGGKFEMFSEEDRINLATQKNEEYVKLIQEITPGDLLPGILPLIQKAKLDGVKIGLASASKNGQIILERLGINEMFHTIVNPEGLHRSKPDPEIFIKAAEQLDLPIVQCIGIEDAEAGIQAIKSAGMWAIGIGDSKILSQANVVFSCSDELDYNEIKQLFLNS